MYFKQFPKFLYDFQYNGKTKTSIVVDITRNIRFRKEILANVALYDEYDIVDGETPEMIAEKVYGNPEYHWIIMLANDKFDYLADFPLEEVALVKYIVAKYGAQRYSVHHYETTSAGEFDFDTKLHVVNSDHPGCYPVSNDEYERRLNESKRRIKLISPNIISAILKQYREDL